MMSCSAGFSGMRSTNSSTTPPMSSASEISTSEWKKTPVMTLWRRTPKKAAGRKAMMTPSTKRWVRRSRGRSVTICQRRAA